MILTPTQQEALAREYAAASPARRSALELHWKRQYGPDTAYELFLLGCAFALYPEDPSEFRATWGRPTNRREDWRAAALALSDDDVVKVAAHLRDAAMNHPSELPNAWALAVELAGVA